MTVNAMVKAQYMINQAKQLCINKRRISKTFKNIIVHYSILKDLKNPSVKCFGIEMFPKILPCYDSGMIQYFIKYPLKCHYSSIIDIGYAEGHYAVGLEIKYPRASIYAYNTD
jgi:hypothetical protein